MFLVSRAVLHLQGRLSPKRRLVLTHTASRKSGSAGWVVPLGDGDQRRAARRSVPGARVRPR